MLKHRKPQGNPSPVLQLHITEQGSDTPALFPSLRSQDAIPRLKQTHTSPNLLPLLTTTAGPPNRLKYSENGTWASFVPL